MNHLGRYEITSELGRGGMGVVYLAKDPKINRPVAMKCLHLSQGGGNEEKKRFAKEMRALGRLVHPNIVTIFDADEDPVTGNAYIVMEYVEGKSLAQILSEGQQLTINQIREIGVQICMALDFAHEKGIVHRDMKPGNVLIAYDAQELNQTVKLVDFGIARLEEEGATQTSSFLGTPRYMSPEQCNGDTIDKRSDMFSASAVIYELLTLRKAFSGDSPAAIIHQVVTHRPDPPMSISNEVPKDLSDAVMKGLEKKPADRFPSCREMAQALSVVTPSAMSPNLEASSATILLDSDETIDSQTVPISGLQRHGKRRTLIVTAVLGVAIVLGVVFIIGLKKGVPDFDTPSTQGLPAPVKPNVVPAEGDVDFLIDPAGAKVFIDGNERGMSPLLLSLPAGPHELKVVKPGYNLLEATIDVPAGETTPIELTLEKKEE